MDDYKSFKAPRYPLYTMFWIGIAIMAGLLWLIPEQQGAVQEQSSGARRDLAPLEHKATERATPAKGHLPASAPYQPCPKLRSGKWLKWEVAQQTRQGWIVTCSYEGDAALFARDEMRL